MHIALDPNVKPVVQAERRIPIPLEEAVSEKLDELEKHGIIEKVQQYSPWQSAIVPVVKKDGSIRICVNMRPANRAVLKESHPLPTIDQIASRMHGAAWFSTLDIEQAFHQLEIDEASREITTFRTHKGFYHLFWFMNKRVNYFFVLMFIGLYRYRRLMFGLSSAPEIFQRTLESLLSGIKGVLNFIDDIMVFGATEEEHDEALRQVLAVIAEYGIKIKLDKLKIKKRNIDFIGYEFGHKGYRPLQNKVDQIKEWRIPTTKEELQSLLGLIQYVGAKFVFNLSDLTEPLRRICSTGGKYLWGEEQQRAFEKIKEQLQGVVENGFYSRTDRTIPQRSNYIN